LKTKRNNPTFEQLVNWLEGRLPPEEARLVSEHMAAADASELADVAWLKKFYEASQGRISPAPPPAVADRLTRTFSAYAQTRRQPSLFQRLAASLSFDSRRSGVEGVRSASLADSHCQLVYETDLATIALTVQRRGQDDTYDLLGQLLPAYDGDVELVRVSLLREQAEFDTTVTDDLGEFTLTALPPGPYTLVLISARYEIKIAPLELSV
jgi:hypothetical protein